MVAEHRTATTAGEGPHAASRRPARHKALREGPDPESRPDGVPAPWSALEWRPLAAARNATKAHVFVAERDGGLVVCKDATRASRRLVLGAFRRWTLRNETRALRRLQGLPGIPALLGEWRDGFVMSHVPGRLLTQLRGGQVADEVFDRLDALLAAIHARDLALCDLHRRNILVDEAGRVGIIDFELALDTTRGLGRLAGRARLERFDRLAAARQRERFGATLLPAHVALLEHPPLWYRITRRIKRWRSNLLRR